MKNYYFDALQLEPSPKSFLLVFVAAVSLAVVTWLDWIPDQIWMVLIGSAFLLLFLTVGMSWLHWQVGMWTAHYREIKEAEITTDEVVIYRLRNELAERQLQMASKIKMMDQKQLDVLAHVPGVPEIDLYPSGLEFLMLTNTSKRVPMTIVRDVASTWVQLVRKGRNPYLLPPLNLWSDSKVRSLIRDLYDEMAVEGLLKVFNDDGDWRSGKLTASLAEDVMPVQLMVWMRVAGEYEIEEQGNDE